MRTRSFVSAAVIVALAAAVQFPALAAEFRVNLNDESKQRHAVVAYDAEGGSLVVWTNLRYGISARYFPARGEASRDLNLVTNRWIDQNPGEGTVFIRKDPTVAFHPSGDFYLFWTEETSYLRASIFREDITIFSQDILGQRFRVDGTPVTGRFRVNRNRDTFNTDPEIAMRDNGSFVVVWRSDVRTWQRNGFRPGPSQTEGIFGRLYRRGGAAAGPAFKIDDDPAGRTTKNPAVAITGNGRFLVAWQRQVNDVVEVRGRLFSADGAADGASFQLNGADGIGHYSPAVAAQDGQFLTAWTTRTGPREYRVMGQMIGRGGSFLGPQLALSASPTDTDDEDRAHAFASIAASPDGGFIAGWLTWHGDLQSSADARWLDALGNPTGFPFRLNEHHLSSQQLDLAVAPNGGVTAVWEGYTDGEFGISARVIAPGETKPAPITPTGVVVSLP
ncbi:MAG: hypothetical protein AAF481_09695 [Acidobacteriota bacterium]